MTVAVVALLALAAALVLWPSPRVLVSRRALRLRTSAASGQRALGAVRAPRRSGGGATMSAKLPAPVRRWVLAVAAGAAVGLAVGGLLGVLSATAVATAAERILRRRPREDRSRRDRLLTDLPVACDLLAACLSAGVPPASALAAVGAAGAGPLGERLATVAGLLRLGAEPRNAWADAPAELAALARLLIRAGETGAAVSGALRTLAADSRASARSRAEARVRRAGVWVLAPLGACFLPGFLCLGVIPLVLGIATGVFG